MAERTKRTAKSARKRRLPPDSGTGYRRVFQHFGVSLWEEDISELRSTFLDLKSQGVSDLRDYLDAHPGFLSKAAHTIKVVDVNDATLRLYEAKSKEELLGSLDKTLDLDDLAVVESMKDNLLAIWNGAGSYESESMAETPSGRELALAVKAYIPPETDEYPYMLVSIVDMTEQKRLEESRERERSLAMTVIDNLPDLIYLKDRESRFVLANSALAEFMGAGDSKNIAGKTDRDFYPGEMAEKFLEDERKVVETATPIVSVEEPARAASGSLRWILTTKIPILDKDGSVTGIVGIGRDITEHKLAQTEVPMLKRRLEFILGATRTGLDIIDANHNVRYVDPEWQKVYGDPKGRKCHEYFMGARAVCPGCGIPSALTTRQTTVSEEVLPKEGNRSIQVTTIPFQDENGEWLVAEVNVDITERKRAEATLQAAKEYAENLIQTANVLVVGLDINGKITVFNRAAEQITGYSRAELENRNWFDVIVPRSRYPEVRSMFERLGRGGLLRNFENPILTKSGEERYVVWQNNEVREGDRIVGSISFGMDITERRRAEEKSLQLAALVESSDDAIVGLNLDRIITSWNRGAERVYGYSAEEIIGRPTSLLIPEDLEHEAGRIRERINQGKHVEHHETIRKRKDGTRIDISLTVSPVQNTEGELSGYASIARDITEQKLIAAQLMRVQKLESLSTLAGGIAHQFNNINTVINGYLELLAMEESLPERARTYLHAAQHGVQRAAEITDRLLVLTGSSQARRESIRLDELARSRVTLLDSLFQTEGISVRFDLRETVPIEAVSSQLDFMLTSLLTNALHSLIGRPVRVVTVRTGSVSGFAFLEVSDTGCGIASENLTRIFTPFFTTKGEFASTGSSQAKVKGVGLSLAVCQAVVSEYGGRIDVESQPGAGSTFRLRFPAAAAGA